MHKGAELRLRRAEQSGISRSVQGRVSSLDDAMDELTNLTLEMELELLRHQEIVDRRQSGPCEDPDCLASLNTYQRAIELARAKLLDDRKLDERLLEERIALQPQINNLVQDAFVTSELARQHRITTYTSLFLMLLGFVIAIWGFVRWYQRVQVHLDRILAARASESLNAQTTDETRNAEDGA